MAKKQKSRNSYQANKIGKAQHRNEYFRNYKRFLNQFCNEDVYSTIPNDVFDYLYQWRSNPIKFALSENVDVSKETLAEIQAFNTSQFKGSTISIACLDITISIYDFFVYGIGIYTLINVFEKDTRKSLQNIFEILAEFKENFELYYDEAIHIFFRIVHANAVLNSDFHKTQYWYNYVSGQDLSKNKSIQNTCYLNSFKLPTEHIVIDYISRPIKKLGRATVYNPFRWFTVDSSLIFPNSPQPNQQYEVYFQNHAIERLLERIDCCLPEIVFLSFYESFEIPEVILLNNTILIEFKIFDIKAGYFVASCIDNKIILRTFLFITSSGTPEGNKLEQITGLQKEEKAFFAVDKLSTFMYSEIENNPQIKQILIDSDCQSIINLHERIAGFILDSDKQINTNALLSYISLNSKFNNQTL